MAPKHPKRPRDFSQAAKLVVDIAAGEVDDRVPAPKDPAASAFARLGGLKGGKARAAKLSPEERQTAARNAANARWQNRKS